MPEAGKTGDADIRYLARRGTMELPSHPFDWRAAWLFRIEMNNPKVTEHFLHLLKEVQDSEGVSGSAG